MNTSKPKEKFLTCYNIPTINTQRHQDILPYNKEPNSSAESLKIMRNHGFLMNLPSDIMVHIISRLPVKSVIHCKCVCKAWLELISGPEFVALHFSRSRPCLIAHHSEMFKNFLKVVEFDGATDHRGLHYDERMKFDLTRLSRFPDADIVVDGSIDGFIFLRDVNYKHETLFICNPVTREYIILPQPKCIVRYPSVVTHGFGVGAVSGQYKVVRIFHERELDPLNGSCLRIPSSECQVYTLGTGRSWRGVGGVSFGYNSNSTGLLFKGNLHWLVEDLEGSELISCFDLEKEFFQPIPPPFPKRKLLGTLGDLGGFLCLCDNTSEHMIDIWVMKEYGVKESWTKEIVINKMPELVGPTYVVVHALKIFRDGVILLLWGDFFMLFYCSKSKTSREVDMDQSRGPNSIEAMHHVSTFLSLRSFVVENVYIL